MPFQPNYLVSEDRQAYTLEGGRVGALMLHGFMGSPTSSRPLAHHLARHGISAHCPLLPGHGELPDKMYGVRRQQWVDEVEEGLETLRRRADEIFVVAHSMGTVLGAHLAINHPEIRGMVMLAPLYKVPNRALHLLRPLRYVMPWLYPWRLKPLRRLTRERVLDLYPDLDLDDPEVQAWLPRATRIPVGAIEEMRKMAALGRRLWPQLQIPVMILQGEKDIAVRPGAAHAVYERVASSDKAFHLFPQAGHELMRPFERAHVQVWSLVLEFIRERASHPVPLPQEEGAAQQIQT
ncbi:MAG: alpha/beta fold hydrolase [Anaerolineae bacterium]|nr:alpha/beta fold hydrolase [Anaerolineae bacterium]